MEETPELSAEDLEEKIAAAYKRRVAYVEDTAFSQWAFDTERKAFETYTEETDDGKTAVYMLLPAVGEPLGETLYRDATPVKNLEFILFEPEKGEETDAVKNKAQAVLDQWKKENEANAQDAFKTLMQEYGGDTSLNLERGRVAAELEAWIFDEARQTGDTTVIAVAEGAYILHMLADGEPQWQTRVRAGIWQEALDAKLEGLSTRYEARYSEKALYDISQIQT